MGPEASLARPVREFGTRALGPARSAARRPRRRRGPALSTMPVTRPPPFSWCSESLRGGDENHGLVDYGDGGSLPARDRPDPAGGRQASGGLIWAEPEADDDAAEASLRLELRPETRRRVGLVEPVPAFPLVSVAEDRGFEPLRALTQPAFQASAIGH